MTAPPAGEESLPPSRPGTPKLRLASSEPRIFGLLTPVTAVVLAAAGLIGGVALTASASALAGVALIAGATCLLGLGIQAARRWPASRLSRVSTDASNLIGRRLGLARASAGAWSDASRRRAQLEREIRALREERRDRQADLGEAAYRDESGKVDRLRRRLGQLDRRIQARERDIDDVSEQARDRVERERAAAPVTQPFAVAEVPPPPGADDDTHAFPTEEHPAASSDG